MMELFKNKNIAGETPSIFWRDVKFLDIQPVGTSQKEMLALFSNLLSVKCGLDENVCSARTTKFFYIDDAIFTGNRVKRDLAAWIKSEAPSEAEVHIVTMALHSGGHNYASKELAKAAKDAGKEIRLKWWRAMELEDRKDQTEISDVLRPVVIPEKEEVLEYVASMEYPPNLRFAGHVGKNEIFSSDASRQLLEQEFLKAGVRIRKMCPHLNKYQRPLGNSVLETLGFGTLILTFRNCPNNAPLVLWASDPWYPLFPRKTNSDTSAKRSLSC